MKRTLLLTVASLCCAASLSCSEESDPAPDASLQVGADASLQVGADAASSSTCDRAKLAGLWTSTNYSVLIASDLSFQAAGAPNVAVIHVTGTLGGEGCTLTFTDLSGTHACPPNQVGTYTFSVTETSLSLQLVSDACDGRRIPLSGAVLARN